MSITERPASDPSDAPRPPGSGSPRLPGPVAALIGVVAVAAAVAAGHLVAGLTAPGSSPLLAVGNTVRDLTPYPITKAVINAVGTLDKLVLFLGLGAVLVDQPGDQHRRLRVAARHGPAP